MTKTKLAKLIRVKIEKGDTGLFYATSPELRGLLVAKRTVEEVEADIPRAIGELYAVAGAPVAVIRLEDDVDGLQPWVASPVEVAKRALDSAIHD
jgi:hypothetical protein